jgi:hypothetical protein
MYRNVQELLMSKYQPLQTYLERQQAGRVRLSFGEIERLLGFSLPRSAREYRPWWSNNTGGNVAIRAWRDAGWRTADVDMAGEQVTFVRERPETASLAPGLAESGVFDGFAAAPRAADTITINLGEVSRSAARLIDQTAEEFGVSRTAAVAKLLDWVVIERRRRMLRAIRAKSAPLPPGAPDSVELIRRDRDRDEA